MRGRACAAAAAAVITLGGTVSASVPASATEAGPPGRPPAAATCATGRVSALADVPIREWPATGARVVVTARKGARFTCAHGLSTVSDAYTACGRTGAREWMFITLPDDSLGFTYAPCWRDTPE